MKPTIAFLFMILLFVFPRLYAQDFWETLPFPDTAHVRCMVVNNQGHIFVGTGSNNTIGGVYRSMDTGLTWECMLDIGDFGVLSIVINENGYIYIGKTGFNEFQVSTDNGETWEEIILPSYGNIVKIYCQGQDTLYVSRWTDNGACLLRSVDSGQTWGEIFSTTNHTSEYVSDIAISGTGIIYVSLMCYLPDMGGMYKSEDEGENWEFIGLFNHMVSTLELNSENDLFAGVWGGLPGVGFPGLYVLRNEEDEWTELLVGPQITEIAINGANHIYMGSHWPDGVIRSLDNGLTFEMITDGLVLGIINGLAIDINSYIYAFNTKLSRSINPLVSIFEIETKKSNLVPKLYPNPVKDKVSIALENTEHHRNIELRCFNLLGMQQYQTKVQRGQKETTLKVSAWPPGMYVAVVYSDGRPVGRGKFVVQ